MKYWNNNISKLTLITKDRIEPVYKALMRSLNENTYNNKLNEDPNLSV